MNIDLDTLNYTPLIIPTVLIPFTFISVGLSVVATFIAGLFGIELKAEGPKQLLEVLLKPKFLISAIVLNVFFLGGYQAYLYLKNMPVFMMTLEKKHQAIASSFSYQDYPMKLNKIKSALGSSPKKIELKLLWEEKLPMGAFRAPALSSNSLFIGNDDGHVYELNADTGKVLRKFFIGTMVTPAPIIFQGKLYSGEGSHDTHHARVYQYDLKTGKFLNAFNTLGHTEGQPVATYYQGVPYLLIVSGKDGLYAVNADTFKKIWHQNPGHMDASVRVENGVVYASTGREKGDSQKYQTYTLAFDLKTGKELWKNETPMSGWMEPAITSNYACFILGEIYFKTKMGGLSCYDKKTGSPEFTILNNEPLIGVPTVLNEDILVSDLNGKVCLVDTLKRQNKWCFQAETQGKQMTSPAIDTHHNMVIYTTKNNGVYFLDLKTGKEIHHFYPKNRSWNSTYASALMVKNDLVLVDIDGFVSRYQINPIK